VYFQIGHSALRFCEDDRKVGLAYSRCSEQRHAKAHLSTGLLIKAGSRNRSQATVFKSDLVHVICPILTSISSFVTRGAITTTQRDVRGVTGLAEVKHRGQHLAKISLAIV
jgi:hypothetical protein